MRVCGQSGLSAACHNSNTCCSDSSSLISVTFSRPCRLRASSLTAPEGASAKLLKSVWFRQNEKLLLCTLSVLSAGCKKTLPYSLFRTLYLLLRCTWPQTWGQGSGYQPRLSLFSHSDAGVRNRIKQYDGRRLISFRHSVSQFGPCRATVTLAWFAGVMEQNEAIVNIISSCCFCRRQVKMSAVRKTLFVSLAWAIKKTLQRGWKWAAVFEDGGEQESGPKTASSIWTCLNNKQSCATACRTAAVPCWDTRAVQAAPGTFRELQPNYVTIHHNIDLAALFFCRIFCIRTTLEHDGHTTHFIWVLGFLYLHTLTLVLSTFKAGLL